MSACKRHREEDDSAVIFRALTPNSTGDENSPGPLPPGKKRRGYNAGYFEESPDPDDAMDDICEPPGAPTTHVEMVAHLNTEVLQDIVTILARTSNDAQVLIELAYGRKYREPNLQFLAAEADGIFGSRSGRYAIPGMAYADITSVINQLAHRLRPYSSYDMKKSGIEVLLDIALSILRADRSRQAKEVKLQFEKDDCIPQLMLQIIGTMSPGDRAALKAEPTGLGSDMVKSLQYVHEKAVEEYIAGFYDFALVLEVLSQDETI